VKSGTFKARVVRLDTRADVVRWTVNPVLASRIPQRAARAVDSVRALILAGTFTVPASTEPSKK
jgi:basic membrane lipoprotein Med (substrate-binding protein (PBP1-ABC) superfamily)